MGANDTIPDRWDDAASREFDEVELLVYRSNLLGADLRITNFAGGNTSAKVQEADPLTGESVEVLWVKGSGGDLGSAGRDGFASLYLDRLLALEKLYRGTEHEDEMVAYLPHCTFGVNPRVASIDTPLHAYLPYRHVDHMHPDAVIAIAAARDGEALTREVFAGELAWIPWQRPGFDLGLRLRETCEKTPGLRGVVLGGHGLFTWGETSKECYHTTLDVIRRAASWLAEQNGAAAFAGAFGGAVRESLSREGRRQFALGILPELRGQLCTDGNDKIAHFVDSEETLEFVNSARLEELAALGTSCPDHFLRTKIRPMVLACDPHSESPVDVVSCVGGLLESYRGEYAAYYARCRTADSPPMRDPNPVVVLVPSVGILTFAKDKATARIAGEFYVNAINVMRGASSVSEYVGLSEADAFGIEYWELEEAKLRRLPPPKSLAGKVALVTGGAGGIGSATARRLLMDGACVVLFDLRAEALEEVRAELAGGFGSDFVRTVVGDVTDEESVAQSLSSAVAEYGGVDILVANAGIASAAPVEETSLETWNRNLSVLTTGYFLAAREAFKIFKRQATGGAIVFVGSKNALVASPGASAYCTAKSAELHLARCLALEGAPHGIRVNVVNPDAVLTGSQIWSGEWRKERAEAYGIAESELQEHYKNRSLLRRSVLPEDVAEAVCFLAGPQSKKSTGNIINVDAGNAGAFPR